MNVCSLQTMLPTKCSLSGNCDDLIQIHNTKNTGKGENYSTPLYELPNYVPPQFFLLFHTYSLVFNFLNDHKQLHLYFCVHCKFNSLIHKMCKNNSLNSPVDMTHPSKRQSYQKPIGMFHISK